MTSPRVLGNAISSVGTEIAARSLQSLILHGAVISIDPAQLDRVYLPPSLAAGRKSVDPVQYINTIYRTAGRNMKMG